MNSLDPVGDALKTFASHYEKIVALEARVTALEAKHRKLRKRVKRGRR